MTALQNKFNKSSVLNTGPIKKKRYLAFVSILKKKKKAPKAKKITIERRRSR
jgi:hypothetical protein